MTSPINRVYCLRTYSTNDSSLDKFWNNFYDKLLNNHNHNHNSESKVSQYQDVVLNMLHNHKNDQLTEEELKKLQICIEDLTTAYGDIKSIYQATPYFINKLISKDQPTAKDFLKRSGLSDEIICDLNFFDQYTLEAIIIYVLSSLFHCIQETPAVRVSTLIEHLDMYVQFQANLLKNRYTAINPSKSDRIKSNYTTDNNKQATDNNKQATDNKRKSKVFYIGVLLVEFLVNRELISLSKELSFNDLYVAKKKGKYYLPINYYAICNFDLSLLPIKLNLPMVCKPMDWISTSENPSSLSDLRGGYLSMPIGDFYQNRYRLISSRDLFHFHIKFENDYTKLCKIMNDLQSHAFEINIDVLTFINQNYDLLVKSGLLMPKFLASLNIKNSIDLLRMSYLEDPSLTKISNYQNLVKEFMKRIQRARYETFIINLASAYEGYRFYLPAFLDFRGRIYRSGALHFHERDLARSLIVFSDTPYDNFQLDSDEKKDNVYMVLSSAAAFHYKKFISYDDAHQWYLDHKSVINSSDESLIQLAVSASDPYQFISKVLCIEGGKTDPRRIPITQDASASAYQLMSFFLLDKEIAKHTNLIPASYVYDQKINDIYTFFLEEIQVYLHNKMTENLLKVICPRLTRKLIKVLFMPLIYGKTVSAMSDDIFNHFSTIVETEFSQLLGRGESTIVAFHMNKFFQDRFPGIVNLMELIRNVGWLSSALSKPVFYSIPLYTTVQDYMKTKAAKILLYDRIHKKRRQVSLRIPTEDRDQRKTRSATFANFIHQKDAQIAMLMIFNMITIGAPVYTVHDNFITTAPYAMRIPNLYIYNIKENDPLLIINNYLIRNLLDGRASLHSLDKPLPLDFLKSILEDKIPKNLNNTKKLIWEKKINSIYDAYVYYITTTFNYNTETGICNNFEKWNDFVSSMTDWDKFNYNYSLHL
jgi:DNA-directed RNA polymerase